MTRGNQSYWHVFEAIGSVRQLTDIQSQVPDAYFYDAWGNELTSPYSQVSNPFRYVGKYGYYLDTQSALMLLGVRYYSASIGRFWSLDPIKDGVNWYVYVANIPTGLIDPQGTHLDDECARECSREYVRDLNECNEKVKKCRKKCWLTLICYPLCVYYICGSIARICMQEALVEYQNCCAWCYGQEHDESHDTPDPSDDHPPNIRRRPLQNSLR